MKKLLAMLDEEIFVSIDPAVSLLEKELASNFFAPVVR